MKIKTFNLLLVLSLVFALGVGCDDGGDDTPEKENTKKENTDNKQSKNNSDDPKFSDVKDLDIIDDDDEKDEDKDDDKDDDIVNDIINNTLNFLCFTAQEPNSTVELDGALAGKKLKYSTDGLNWNDYTSAKSITLQRTGDKVFFAGHNPAGLNNRNSCVLFDVSGRVAVSGDVMTLVDYTQKTSVIPNNYCFYKLFSGCQGIVNAPAMTATSLKDYCYCSMFEGCTNLKTAGELSAATLAPNCYEAMFRSSALETAPIIAATTLAENCCTSMFENCTMLRKSPELMVKTLASGCYVRMFRGCTSLEKISVGFSSWGNGYTTNWTYGINTTGTLICPESLPAKSDNTGTYIPKNWTKNGGDSDDDNNDDDNSDDDVVDDDVDNGELMPDQDNYWDNTLKKVFSCRYNNKIIALYKSIDFDDYRTNGDNKKFYRTKLYLNIGNTRTLVADDIYTDDNYGNFMLPCMLIESSTDEISVYSNSKDVGGSYKMSGYVYKFDILGQKIDTQVLFTSANWGWYSRFAIVDGDVVLLHFSFMNYYAVQSNRTSDGSWNYQKLGSINPDPYNTESRKYNKILIN
ncbi:MAG: hypothetical protein II956_03170 [Bacteroidales bacterium]|nr:hypothetical protein [Bacteroidales bacterium]